jgi:cell division septum initiation protein DivIVA
VGKKNLTFKTELNGYKKCEVDERLQKDARRIEVLEAQVALVDGLKDENQRLASEVEKYKKCEDEVKNVLAVATKKAFDIKTDMKLQYALETERLKIFKAKWTSAYDELKRKYGFDTDAAIVESTVTDVSLKIEAILNKDFGIRLTDDATDAEKQLMEEADRLSISQDEINKLVEKLKGELKNVS